MKRRFCGVILVVSLGFFLPLQVEAKSMRPVIRSCHQSAFRGAKHQLNPPKAARSNIYRVQRSSKCVRSHHHSV